MKVTPAILAKDFDEVKEKLESIKDIVPRVQIDLCDGVFGAQKTWLPTGNESLPEGVDYEFDVMLNDWSTYVPRCVSLGAKRIVIHSDLFYEHDSVAILNMLENTYIELGVSVSNNVPMESFIGAISFFKENYKNVFAQVMGIKKIGGQGEPFDEDVKERVKELKAAFPDIHVQIDGGMNEENVKKAKAMGIDTVVSGSYVFNSNDKKKAIETLKEA